MPGATALPVDEIPPQRADEHDLSRHSVVDVHDGRERRRWRPLHDRRVERPIAREDGTRVLPRGKAPRGQRDRVQLRPHHRAVVLLHPPQVGRPLAPVGELRPGRLHEPPESERHERGDRHGENAEARRVPWRPGQPSRRRRPEEGAYRGPTRVPDDVSEIRIATRDEMLRELDRQGERQPDRGHPDPAPALAVEQEPQGEKEHHVEQGVRGAALPADQTERELGEAHVDPGGGLGDEREGAEGHEPGQQPDRSKRHPRDTNRPSRASDLRQRRPLCGNGRDSG